ncbi:MAG: 2-isopropylmalate synthase [Candidatus Bathyarchaeota archaeon]|nr:2-isopropylmalate synthase [Candidatus Termitimicrobium sp.]MCL2431878.1 2-isopropylmalate synthase [Candidatus Termitimicrobium sp.]
MRDGEQTPGVSLVAENKLRIAQRLDELGVDVIEAGFASVSEGEMAALRLITNQDLRAEISSAGRGLKGDIDAVLKCGASTMSMIIPTSDLHIECKLHKTRDQVLKATEDCVLYAKDHGLKVDLLAEDATRSDFDYLIKIFQTAVDAGVDRVTPCDTVGILTPDRSFDFFSKLTDKISVPIGVHCHNDFGMAVANTIAALGAGAQEAHATVNGLGERAGNAALEEIVITLRSLYKLNLNIKTPLLYSTSQLVSRLTGIHTQPNKAIVGENAFTHESGIHTQGILANPLTYEPISPELVGCTRRIAPGKHSGSNAIRANLANMGLNPNEEQFNDIMQRIKELGDKGKTVMDADVLAIAETVLGLGGDKPIQLVEMTFVGGNKVTSTASVRLKVQGQDVWGSAIGVGPVDAAINAVKVAIAEAEPITLEQYNVKAITGGTDAMVEVVVHMRKANRTVTAMGLREDIVKASMEAVISGMNVLKTDYNGKPTPASF